MKTPLKAIISLTISMLLSSNLFAQSEAENKKIEELLEKKVNLIKSQANGCLDSLDSDSDSDSVFGDFFIIAILPVFVMRTDSQLVEIVKQSAEKATEKGKVNCESFNANFALAVKTAAAELKVIETYLKNCNLSDEGQKLVLSQRVPDFFSAIQKIDLKEANSCKDIESELNKVIMNK